MGCCTGYPEKGGKMKYFVRVVSVLIILVYTMEGLFFAGVSVWGVVKGVPEIKNVGGGTIDGSPTPILDGIGKFFLGLGCVFLVVVFFSVAAEIFFMIRNYVKAIQEQSFRHYSFMSVIALIAGVVNVIASLIMALVINSIPYLFHTEDFLSGFMVITFFVNLFMEFWSLLNLLSSNECVRDGL